MHSTREIEIKDLLNEVLARLSLLETNGAEANRKIEALSGRVPILLRTPSTSDSSPKVVQPGPSSSRTEPGAKPIKIPVESPAKPRQLNFFRSSPKELPEEQAHRPMPGSVEPRRRAKKPSPTQGQAEGMNVDPESLATLRALMDMVFAQMEDRVSEDASQSSFPIQRIQRTGKFVLRPEGEDGEIARPKSLEFDRAPDSVASTSKPGPRRMTIAAMLMLALLAAGGMVAASKISPRLLPESAGPVKTAARLPFTPVDSRKALQSFLAASSPEEAALHVHPFDGQTPARMREYYSRLGNEDWRGQIMDNQPARAMVAGGNTFHCWRVQTPDGFLRIAPVCRANGHVRLFWEGFVGYGNMDWETFINTRPEEPVELRVLLAKAKNVLSVSNNTLVLEVSHPGSDVSEVVTVADEMTSMLISSSLQDSAKPIPAMVKMAYTADLQGGKTLAITSFLGAGWGEDRVGEALE